MRLALIMIVAVMFQGTAGADTRTLVKQYAGRIVISPDAPPPVASELPAYVKAAALDGDRYTLIKGSPWHIHLVGFLAKEPTTGTPVTLNFIEVAKKPGPPITSVEVVSKGRLVISSLDATVAAGFAEGKTYLVQLAQNKVVLAKAELTLQP